jgi:hypothetical protein
MKTLKQTIGGGHIDNFSNFIGNLEPNENWLVLLSQNRDSDALTRSNFICAIEQLGGENKDVIVLRFGHWGCGWFELLCINPENKEKINIAETIESCLADYPVLNDEHYSNLEYTEKLEYW